jgi:hypothetical protein
MWHNAANDRYGSKPKSKQDYSEDGNSTFTNSARLLMSK